MSNFLNPPTLLEIGPCRGDFLLHLARERPHQRIAAIEYKKKRFLKLIQRTADHPNILLYFGDARPLVGQLFPPATLEEIFILFSDPWPKRRHADHRLFQKPFIQDLHRLLQPGGKIFIATDDPAYRHQIIREFEAAGGFAPIGETPELFPTFYAQKWTREGRSLYHLVYRRDG